MTRRKNRSESSCWKFSKWKMIFSFFFFIYFHQLIIETEIGVMCLEFFICYNFTGYIYIYIYIFLKRRPSKFSWKTKETYVLSYYHILKLILSGTKAWSVTIWVISSFQKKKKLKRPISKLKKKKTGDLSFFWKRKPLKYLFDRQ